MNEAILNRVRDFFLSSRDFNGLLLVRLCSELKMSSAEVKDNISQLVKATKMTLAFASYSVNPHIKRLPDLPVSDQLSLLEKEDLEGICGYPSAEVVRGIADLSRYDSSPFTRRLALVEPQLAPVYFCLDVLERYYRDPRFDFDFEDFQGSISLTSAHYNSPDVAERDRVFLQTFGIGYTSGKERVVAVFLRYLSDLSPEHQQIWNAHVAVGPCSMNSDYGRATICGEWPIHYSAYRALLTEQIEINKLTQLIGKPSLFKETFDNDRPKGFAPMLRPTRRNFDEFVCLLDKILSENINRDFFRGDVPLERRVKRSDGAFEVDRPGTIQLLEDWISKKYRSADGEDLAREILEPLRNIRKLRQSPAHSLRDDEYDRSLPSQQDGLVGKACRTLTQIRLIFSSHPRARNNYSAPVWLDGDMIVFY